MTLDYKPNSPENQYHLTKKCLTCLRLFPYNLFQENKGSYDGHSYSCFKCSSLHEKGFIKKEKLESRQDVLREKYSRKGYLFKLKSEDPEKYKKLKKILNRRRHDREKRIPIYRIRENLRKRMQHVAKQRNVRNYGIRIGCSLLKLKKHISSLFKNGMSWDNYGEGGWTVDHIKPLSAFNLSTKEEQFKANHFSNLQPLWARENLLKGSSYKEGSSYKG